MIQTIMAMCTPSDIEMGKGFIFVHRVAIASYIQCSNDGDRGVKTCMVQQ